MRTVRQLTLTGFVISTILAGAHAQSGDSGIASQPMSGQAVERHGIEIVGSDELERSWLLQTQTPDETAAELRHENPAEAVSIEGLIRLDVTVTDKDGNAVRGLERKDFRVLDDGQPQNIIAFRAASSARVGGEDSSTVILLIDTLDVPPELADFERRETVAFLRSAGRLVEPVSVYTLDDSGFFLTATPSMDAEALAREVVSHNKGQEFKLTRGRSSLVQPRPGIIDLSFIPTFIGLRALMTIATSQAAQPGRKLLLWIGPGNRGTGAYAIIGQGVTSSLSSGTKSQELKRDLFDKIKWVSTLLRQARITVDCFSVAEDEQAPEIVLPPLGQPDLESASPNWWRKYLDGVSSVEQASSMNLYKKVLALQSGGRVLPPSKNLAGQLAESVKDAGTYYTVTFDPPLAAHADEYHALDVELSRPGLTAHTSTSYYDQPFYDDAPNPAIRQVDVAQLEQMVQTVPDGAPLYRQLSTVALTERLSGAKLESLSAMLHGKKLRDLLTMIADESAFLEPPSSEIPGDPSPNPAEQRRILAASSDYLARIILKMPNFLATRTTTYYREVAPYPGYARTVAPEPLHAEYQSKDTVLYRHGSEILEPVSRHQAPIDGQVLTNSGTFGPILHEVRAILETPGTITWKRWENDRTERYAVFHFVFAGSPSITLTGCCFPAGEWDKIGIAAPVYGEIAIDPSTGAILRVELEHDLDGFVPTRRSDMLVSYGPTEISGKTYILPRRSVNIWRGRTVAQIYQLNLDFRTWGPYQSQMNVFTFDRYHVFRSTTRFLPDLKPETKKSSPAPPAAPH